jgi:hypothetical protein
MSLNITILKNKCDCCGRGDIVDDFNITHNLADMAKAVKIGNINLYQVLWRGDEHGFTTTKSIVTPLQIALTKLAKGENEYSNYNSQNGFGAYQNLLLFVNTLLLCAKSNPSCVLEFDR